MGEVVQDRLVVCDSDSGRFACLRRACPGRGALYRRVRRSEHSGGCRVGCRVVDFDIENDTGWTAGAAVGYGFDFGLRTEAELAIG